MDPRYSVVGLLVGTLIGLTGMGGGSIMTPILILLIGIRPTTAVGTDLCYAAVTKIVGAVQHSRNNTVNFRLAHRLAVGSVPGAIAGVWFIHVLENRVGAGVQMWVTRMLGVMLILVAVGLFCRAHPGVKAWSQKFRLKRKDFRWTVPAGFGLLVGFLVGITSVGSGTLFGVLLVLVFGLSARRTVGTDVYHAAILSTAAAAAHLSAGNVDFPLLGSLLIGSVPGVVVGSKLAARVPEKVIRPTLAVVLILSGFRLAL